VPISASIAYPANWRPLALRIRHDLGHPGPWVEGAAALHGWRSRTNHGRPSRGPHASTALRAGASRRRRRPAGRRASAAPVQRPLRWPLRPL